MLELADEITTLFNEAELDFAAVKENPNDSSNKRDSLVVTPPLSVLNEMIRAGK